MVGFPSGQREETVNLPSLTSKVRILLLPPYSNSEELGFDTLDTEGPPI